MANPYLFVSWSEYHLLAQKLAAAILHHTTPIDEIVAISRGGLTFGHILSDLLQIPVYSFTIQSYTDLQAQGELKITQELGKPISGKRILLVDDVADSGKTFTRAVEYLRTFTPEEIITVAMFLKPQSSFMPDFYGKRTAKWIIYPYEVTETIKSITKKMEHEGQSKGQIQNFLVSLGYREGQVAFVRKHHLSKT